MNEEQNEELVKLQRQLGDVKSRSMTFITAKELGNLLIALGDREVKFSVGEYERSYLSSSYILSSDTQQVDFNKVSVDARSVTFDLLNLTSLRKAVNDLKEEENEDDSLPF